MIRSACALLAVFAGAGCVDNTDERPLELAYIVESVLKPNCASAECHSKFTQAARRPGPGSTTSHPIVLDNVADARLSIELDDQLFDHFGPDADAEPTLITNLTVETASAPRMPLDGPMPAEDVELIREWIKHGGPGLCDGSTIIMGGEKYCCDSDGAILGKTTSTACH